MLPFTPRSRMIVLALLVAGTYTAGAAWLLPTNMAQSSGGTVDMPLERVQDPQFRRRLSPSALARADSLRDSLVRASFPLADTAQLRDVRLTIVRPGGTVTYRRTPLRRAIVFTPLLVVAVASGVWYLRNTQ